MLLRDVPDARLREDLLRYHFRHAVEEVGDDPVEHLDQERELLQYPAVDVVREAGGVRSVDCHPAAVALLRVVLGCGYRIL